MKEDNIPMSSVVVQDRQPPSTISTESPSTSSYNIESQELIGLGPLRSASKLFIKQRIRASDICALLTGCEVSVILEIAICSPNCVQIWQGRDRKTVFCRVRHKKMLSQSRDFFLSQTL